MSEVEGVSERARLSICSTPIGNLSDTSQRLLETLQAADVILCEDTRHTRKLLTHFDIHPAQLASYHQHNERSRQDWIKELFLSAKHVALVSDAGTPILSDPGAVVVETAIELGIDIVPVPGPSALLAGLVGSGLPLTPFVYLGFPPRQNKARQDWLAPFVSLPATLVIYESPHRLTATLNFLLDALGDRTAVLARELTKRYETFSRSALSTLLADLETEPPRGEYVVMVDNRPMLGETATEAESSLEIAIAHVLDAMHAGARHKEAVAEAVQRFGVNRRDLYNATLRRNEG